MKKRYIIIGIVVLLILGDIVWQLLYPQNFIPAAFLDKNRPGYITREQASNEMRSVFLKKKVGFYVKGHDGVVAEPTLETLGVSINTKQAIDEWKYPWYWKLVPTSQLWIEYVTELSGTKITVTDKTRQYIDAKLGPICRTPAVNAKLGIKKQNIVAINAVKGISCTTDDVELALQRYVVGDAYIEVQSEPVEANLTAGDIEPFIDTLNARLRSGVSVEVLKKRESIPLSDVVPLIAFTQKNDVVDIGINTESAIDFFTKRYGKDLKKEPGVTTITTRDLVEVSRNVGADGRAVDIPRTVDTLKQVINGKRDAVVVATKNIPAKVKFVRTYSKSNEAITALLKQYAEDNEGKFGISYVELSGAKRRASYQGDTQFTTASIYKLFVAYSLLQSIEEGKRSWVNEEACFNKMISLSDNPCAEEDLMALGLGNITRDMQSLGLGNTTFLVGDTPLTTANDVTALLASIEQSQALTGESRQRLLSAMRGNVYRKGIPSGTSSVVANKVGFLWNLKHDAAIVYSPKGTYVLTVMTDGAGWDAIAELTRKIEEIR